MKKSNSSLRASNGPSSKRKSLNPTKEEEQQIAYNAELQRLVFNVTEDKSEESLKTLQQWYSDIKLTHVDLNTATNLVNVLIRLIGKREHRIYGKPSAEAQLALVVLFEFVKQVEEVQDAFEGLSNGDLRQMRLHKHVLECEEEHQNIAVRFVHFLMNSFPKCSQLKDFIPDDVKEVSQMLLEKRNIIDQNDALYRKSFDEKAPNSSPTYFDADVETVVALFKTSIDQGLNDTEVIARREHYGQNLLPKPKKKSIWRMLWNQVRDIMILILVVAMGASAGIGDYKAMGALAAVVVINIIIGFTQEYKAEKALNALLKLDVPTARVLRNGEVDTLPAADLVPGDIVLLEEGVAIPADIRLCEAVNLQVIEAILTGESTAIEKNTQKMAAKRPPLGDRLNMGYMSTVVVKGRGKGIVTTTGASTEMGKISVRLNNAKSPKTPLQKRLTKLGIILVIVAVVLCVIIVVVGFVRGNYWLDMLKVGVSLAVSVIPEGLVAVTTVTMAIGVSRMSKHNVLVRQLHAVETLGSITTICSDKTGTLTEGKMTAKKVWVSGREYRVKGRSTDPKDTSGKFTYKTKDDQTEEITRDTVPSDLRFLLMGAGLCNNTGLAENDEGQTVMTGDPTEVALHIAAIKLGLGKERFTEEGFQFVNEHSFDSDRKRMSVVYKTADKYYILAKGAPESLLKKSTKYLSGEKHKDLEKKLKKIEKQGAKMAGQGLRILAFGYKTYELDEKTDEEFKNVENVESDLCFVGLIGLLDPPRKNVSNVIKQCRDAGIRVCMITGDHPSTAKAIAIKLGIATEESNVLTGEQIDLLYESKQLATLDPFPTVFARVSPDNKLQIVETLQKKGEVAAMTGDGVNDAPAIKKSDCGVAMGITGTDITKQAASIVLTDDDFKSIVYAVKEGRRIYDNIKKFIIYLLSCNTAEILTMLLAVIIAAPIPFASIQILWANIIADIPPAMSLGIDPAELDVMSRKPRNPKQGIFTVRSGFVLLAQGLSMAGLALATLLIGFYVEGLELSHLQTVTFTVLTMTQLWHSFLSRSQTQSIFRTGLIANKWLIGAFFLSASLLIMSIYIPGFNDFFELVPLNGWDWLKVVASMIIHTGIMEIIKACLRLRASILRKKAKPTMFYNDV